MSRLDIILFGATGFTGKHCIEKLHNLSKAKGRTLSWGIAGRSEKKLTDVLVEYGKKLDADLLNSIPKIIADVSDYESIKLMTGKAKAIINCCGPYRFYGEAVVKACIETGTHQVDVTGEPQFMETMQLNYDKAAQEKGVYIVSACGFDSIPADLGVVFLEKNFQGTLNSVETYLEAGEEPPKTPGPSANYATWESAIHGIGHASEMVALRRKLYPTRLPTLLPKLNPRGSIHKSNLINAWCVPFLGSDRSVVVRSQRHFFETQKKRPIQVQTYLGLDSVFTVILLAIFGTLFTLLAKYNFGRQLLLKYPKFFSAGFFAHESPSEEKTKRTKFSLTFYGEGWSNDIPEGEDLKTAPNKKIVGRVGGVDMGYGITSAAVTLSAIVLLTEKEKLPQRGGVCTPAVAFSNTSLIEQLQENGLAFNIISNTF